MTMFWFSVFVNYFTLPWGFLAVIMTFSFMSRSFGNWHEIERLLELGESYDEVLNRRYDKNRIKKLMKNARLESNMAYICFFFCLLSLSLGANLTYFERVDFCKPNLSTKQNVGYGVYYDVDGHSYKSAADCVYAESRMKNIYHD